MIYFVRHGQTDYNLKKLIQGHLDIPLNDTGIEQAKIVRESLKNIKFDVVYCSPLARAKVTADIINKYHNLPIIYDKRLMEFDAGSGQGKPTDMFNGETHAEYFQHPELYGAESNQQFYDRVASFFDSIKDDNKNILVVSHGGVYRNLYRYVRHITNFGEMFFTPKNCDIVMVDGDKISIMGGEEIL